MTVARMPSKPLTKKSPPAARPLWKSYLGKRNSHTVTPRVPPGLREKVNTKLATEGRGTFLSFTLDAVERVLQHPPRKWPDYDLTGVKKFTQRWPEGLVARSDEFVEKHGISRNTMIIYALEQAL